MATPAVESTPVPVLASVVVVKIKDFTRKPVAEQGRLKERLEALVAGAIQSLSAADRVVLEVPDGTAVVVLGGPQAALEIAERCQTAADLPLCIGVNHGPVMPASDVLRGPGLVGDGLAAGLTLANATTPGRFIASRSFREALEVDAPGRAEELSSAGVFTDPKVRTHELFTLDRRGAPARRRRLMVSGAIAVVVILGLGVAARLALRTGPPPRPAAIEFAITPRGEIFVDGVLKGSSPPLTRLELKPGPHAIEVRLSPHPPLKLQVDLAAAEEMRIAHSFAYPKAPAKAPVRSPAKSAPKEKDVDDYVRELRRQLGF